METRHFLMSPEIPRSLVVVPELILKLDIRVPDGFCLPTWIAVWSGRREWIMVGMSHKWQRHGKWA